MSSTLAQRDQAVVWHPFTQQKNRPLPIPIIKGKGTILYNENGEQYIDAISSWWVTLHGHAHPYIAEKIYQQALQLEQVIFAGFTHEPAVALAEQLLQILPHHFSRIFYSDNGSTSTEVALKMALQYWWNLEVKNNDSLSIERTKILAFNNAYHGDTFGAMSVSDRSVFTKAFNDKLFDVVFIDTPTTENIEDLISVVNSHSNTLAAFIYEPLVQGAGGIKMYEAEVFNQLLIAVKKHNIICIADEVMTGFGRTGRLFASEYMKHQPDIICLSKGLTGGTMALGVTACSHTIYNAFVNDDKLKTFFHGHSFTANPLACTAALASLHLLQQPYTLATIAWLTEQNKEFATQLTKKTNSSTIKNIRTLGTILAFEIANGRDEYLNTISTTITKEALLKGVYLRPLGNTVYIMPPYCINPKELHKVYSTLESIVANFSN